MSNTEDKLRKNGFGLGGQTRAFVISNRVLDLEQISQVDFENKITLGDSIDYRLLRGIFSKHYTGRFRCVLFIIKSFVD